MCTLLYSFVKSTKEMVNSLISFRLMTILRILLLPPFPSPFLPLGIMREGSENS